RVLYFVDPTKAQPASHEDGFLLEVIELLVDVAFARQVPAALHILDARLDLIEDLKTAFGYAGASCPTIAVMLAVHPALLRIFLFCWLMCLRDYVCDAWVRLSAPSRLFAPPRIASR